jgi:hypothetical protein
LSKDFNIGSEAKTKFILEKVRENAKSLVYILKISSRGHLMKEFFYNNCVHQNVVIRFNNIKQYNHLELSAEFEKKFGNERRMLLWHGANRENLESFLVQGFNLPEHDRGMFGRSIYFAD